MTTPRDDIAGLSERLRKRSEPSEYSTGDVLGEEAATQLDSLLKERDALKDLAKELSDALLTVRPLGGSELFIKRFGQHYADPVYCKAAIEQSHKDRHEAQKGLIRYRRQAAKAEQERDALQARVKELEENITEIPQLLRKANAHALRAEQERDEAYERLKPFAKDAAKCEKLNPNNSIAHVTTARVRDLRSARDLVRRLAGPEKIAAANDEEERKWDSLNNSN